jgi:hypothetical protein
MTVTRVPKPCVPQITRQLCNKDVVSGGGGGVLAQRIKIMWNHIGAELSSFGDP